MDNDDLKFESEVLMRMILRGARSSHNIKSRLWYAIKQAGAILERDWTDREWQRQFRILRQNKDYVHDARMHCSALLGAYYNPVYIKLIEGADDNSLIALWRKTPRYRQYGASVDAVKKRYAEGGSRTDMTRYWESRKAIHTLNRADHDWHTVKAVRAK